MSDTDEYEVIKSGIADTSEAPRGKDIYYRYAECGGVIPSDPKDNVGCPCGNIFTDFKAKTLRGEVVGKRLGL